MTGAVSRVSGSGRSQRTTTYQSQYYAWLLTRRAALVEHFQERGTVMITTEAGAEGINLQFCSLVINYDLPWNPQRIEQRIGRCHRYGQKFDVVVNFVDRITQLEVQLQQQVEEQTLFTIEWELT